MLNAFTKTISMGHILTIKPSTVSCSIQLTLQLSSLKSTNIKIDPILSKSDTMETIEEFPSVIGPMNVRQVICILGMMIGKTKIL